MNKFKHNRMKNVLSILIILFFLFVAPVQLWSQKISGIVLSANDSLPIMGSTIQVMNLDSMFVAGTTTDSNGIFMVETANTNNVILAISSIGYILTETRIEGIKNAINMGTIYLHPSSTELGEVVVKGSSRIQKVDQSIIFPSPLQLKVSNSVLSLLQNTNLPGLSVNVLEQTVSINGNAPVYMINGVVKTKQDILTISPKNIEKVEYSDNPTIRYLDKGAGGIINIILKEKEDGGSFWGNVTASPMTGFLNTDLYFAYNQAKSEFSINYFNSWRDYDERWTNKEEAFIGPDYTIERTFAGVHSPFSYLNQGLYLGYTYQHDKNTMFSATLRNDFGRQQTSVNGDITESNRTAPYFRNSKSKFGAYIPAIDLFFSKKMKGNQSFEVNMVGTLQDTDYERDLSDMYTDDTSTFRNEIETSRRSLISEIVYRKDWENISLNLGFQNTVSKTINTYKSSLSEEENLSENNNYLYGGLSGTVRKLSYSIGSGIKMFFVDNRIDDKSYIKNQSSLSLLYPIRDNLNVQLYSYFTPSLPSLSQLNNVTQVYDNILDMKGNPDLKASHSLGSRLQINYQKDKFSLNLSGMYQRQENPVYMKIRPYENTNRFLSEYRNAHHANRFNGETKISFMGLLDHINIFATAGYNDMKAYDEDFTHSLNHFYWDLSAQVYWKDWTLSAYYIKPKKQLLIQTIDYSENNSQISLGYRYKGWDFLAAVKYPFESSGWHWEEENLSAVNPSRTEVFIKDNSRMLVLSVTYSLDFGIGLKKSNKNLNNTDKASSILKVQE